MNDEEEKHYDSPDGALRIISSLRWEERFGPSDTTQVNDLRSGAILATLPSVRLEGSPEWIPAGGAAMNLRVQSVMCRVQILADHTFVLAPFPEPRPLADLAASLWALVPRASAPPVKDDRLGWGTILGSLAAVAVGVAGILHPRPGRHDPWWGAASAVFFGAIALLGLWEKWRRK